MNENIDLTKILKDCPKGTTLYSSAYGNVRFNKILSREHTTPIIVSVDEYLSESFTADGKMYPGYDGECALFPSREQRDWSKFTASWLKKERFDPNTLLPYEKVLVRDSLSDTWFCKFFSHIMNIPMIYKYATTGGIYKYCIPYNDDTKHLVGTKEEAPEYYIYWED